MLHILEEMLKLVVVFLKETINFNELLQTTPPPYSCRWEMMKRRI
jgi:hypothetical protein